MSPADQAEAIMLCQRIEAKIDRIDALVDSIHASFDRIEAVDAAFRAEMAWFHSTPPEIIVASLRDRKQSAW